MKWFFVVVALAALTALVRGTEIHDLSVEMSSASADNSTDDLEIRVTLLEDDVTDLQDEVEEMETDINQLEYRLLVVEGNVADSSNDIDDLETSVAETEDLITVLDDDVTDLDVLVSTLQEENAQLQQTVNLLLQRVSALESTDAITNNTLNGFVDDLDAQQTQITNITKEVDFLDSEVTILNDDVRSLNKDVSSQDMRLDSVEDEVDEWDDKITALEVANVHIIDRLAIVEEILLEPWVGCVSSPCDNGGTCIDVNVDTYVCMCRDGFFGETCGNSYSGTSFLATFDTTTLTPGDPIVFNYPVHNAGGHYYPITGIYTTPIDGTYEFIFHFWANIDATIGVWLVVDGHDVTNTLESNSEYPYELINMAVILQLQKGQEVWVRPNSMDSISGASSADGMYSWFSGHLLYAL